MKTIGLVGGLTWVSTLDYYRHINTLVNERLGGDEAAELLMYSVNFGEIKRLTLAGDWEGIAGIIINAAQTLESAGAACILLGANTMHKVAPQVSRAIGIPLLHIADATAMGILEKGLHTVALLGTQYTMRLPFYHEVLAAHGIEAIIPNDEGVDMVNNAIYNEMGKGLFLPETKATFISLIEHLAQNGAEGVILGCTEIPLLISPEDVSIPVFDTAWLHARAAVDFALS